MYGPDASNESDESFDSYEEPQLSGRAHHPALFGREAWSDDVEQTSSPGDDDQIQHRRYVLHLIEREFFYPSQHEHPSSFASASAVLLHFVHLPLCRRSSLCLGFIGILCRQCVRTSTSSRHLDPFFHHDFFV